MLNRDALVEALSRIYECGLGDRTEAAMLQLISAFIEASVEDSKGVTGVVHTPLGEAGRAAYAAVMSIQHMKLSAYAECKLSISILEAYINSEISTLEQLSPAVMAKEASEGSYW